MQSGGEVVEHVHTVLDVIEEMLRLIHRLHEQSPSSDDHWDDSLMLICFLLRDANRSTHSGIGEAGDSGVGLAPTQYIGIPARLSLQKMRTKGMAHQGMGMQEREEPPNGSLTEPPDGTPDGTPDGSAGGSSGGANRSRLVEVYQSYVERIYAFVAARVEDRQDAEDIVAEVFLNAARGFHRLRDDGDPVLTAWLFTIARNGIATHFRRRRPPPVSLDDMEEAAGTFSLDADAAQAEDAARLRRLIRDLPPRQQEIVTLRFFGGLRNLEIAALLKLDERTVAAHLSRGLKTLHDRYEAQIGSTERVEDSEGGERHVEG